MPDMLPDAMKPALADLKQTKAALIKLTPEATTWEHLQLTLVDLLKLTLAIHPGTLPLDQEGTLVNDTMAVCLQRMYQFAKKRAGDAGTLPELTATAVFLWAYRSPPLALLALINSLQLVLSKILAYMTLVNRRPEIACWADTIVADFTISKSGFIMLEMVLRHVDDCGAWLARHPRFTQRVVGVIERDPAVAHAASRPLLTLFRSMAPSVTSPEEWLALWQPAVMPALKARLAPVYTILLAGLLPIAHGEYCFHALKQEIVELGDMLAVLMLLKVGQDCKLIAKPYQALEPAVLHQMLVHADPQVRLGVLLLLLGSTAKNVRVVAVDDAVFQAMDQAQVVLLFANEYEHIEARQAFIALMLLFAPRLQETIKQHPQGVAKEWVDETLVLCKRLLLPSANYSQMWTLLHLYHTFLTKMECPKVLQKVFADELLFLLLVQTLFNDYEVVRNLARTVLHRFPRKQIDNYLTSQVKREVFQQSIGILSLLEGRKTDGATNYIEFLAELNLLEAWNTDVAIELLTTIDSGLSLGLPAVHGHFGALERLLELGVDWLRLEVALVFAAVLNAWLGHGSLITKDHAENYGEELHEGEPPATRELTPASAADDDTVAYNYAWKVVKASNLVLARLFTLESTPDSVVEAGCQLIIEQIATIKHRGAVSLIYPSFVTGCATCHQRPALSELPAKWLEANLELDNIQGILRRSGGVPYLITGILSALPDRKLLDLTFEKTLAAAREPVVRAANARYDSRQVHAFNVMKQVFGDAQLGPKCGDYLSQALSLSLEFFTAESWSVRNCAVMLFNTVRQRMFGLRVVPLASFFSKFPDVGRLVQKYLNQELTEGILSRVFPVVMILMCLTPSQDDDILNLFKPALLALILCRHWHVRQIAARAVSKLYTKAELGAFIRSLLNTCQWSNFNYIHGALLTVAEIRNEFATEVSDFAETAIVPFCAHQPPDNVYALVKCLKAPLSATVANQLGHYFCAHDNTSQGNVVLCLAAICRLLLAHYHEQNDRELAVDLMRLALTMHFEVQLPVYEYIIDHPDYSEISSDVWRVISTNEWTYTTDKALGAYRALLLAEQAHPPSQPRQLLELKEPQSLECYALVVLAAGFKEFLDICEERHDTKAVLTFILRDLGRDTESLVRGMIILAVLGLFNSDELVREQASDAIAGVLDIPQPVNATYLSLVFPDKMLERYGSDTVGPIARDYALSFCRFKPPVVPHILYGVERENLYQNDVFVVGLLGKMMQGTTVGSALAADVIQATRVVERLGYDGVIGWLRHEYNFVPLIKLLVLAYFIDLDVSGIKRALIVAKCTLTACM